MSASPRPSFSPGRRWLIAASVAVSAAAAAALVAMANFLAAHHFQRFVWSDTGDYRLSSATLQLLRSLTNEVRVTVFFDKDEQPLFDHVNALLDEYAIASPQVSIERVDYVRGSPAAAQRVKEKYRLSFQHDKNQIIFDCGGRVKIIHQTELSDYDVSRVLSGESREVKRTAFKGEALFTAAVLSVVEARRAKAFFLHGHRELDPASDSAQFGYRGFAQLLALNNVETQPLSLHGTNTVPDDCQLLVVLGPADRIPDLELARIDAYLNQGGRGLFLLGPSFGTGLETLLAQWGAEAGVNLVVDEPNSNAGVLAATNFASHPITAPLHDARVYFRLPRSVDKRADNAQAADAPHVEELIWTSAHGQALTTFRDRVAYPSARDRRGVLPLAATIEKGSIRGVTARHGASRLVVLGDARVFANDLLELDGNYDLAVKCLNWLLERPQLLAGISPKPVREYRLVMTRAEKRAVRWMLLAGMPGAVLLFGLLVWWRHRH
jgi:hypothetical protein